MFKFNHKKYFKMKCFDRSLLKEFIEALKNYNYQKLDEILKIMECSDINDFIMEYYSLKKMRCVYFVLSHDLLTIDIMKIFLIACRDEECELINFIVKKHILNPLLDINVGINYSIMTNKKQLKHLFSLILDKAYVEMII